MDEQQHQHGPPCVKLWQVLLTVFMLGTLPGIGAAVVFTTTTEDNAVKYVNETRDLSRDGCHRDNGIRTEMNERVEATVALRDAMRSFVRETRRARSNKGGSSYDPHFVAVIDRRVLPRLDLATYDYLPMTDCDEEYPRLTNTAQLAAHAP